jgi:mRNA (guanine-N7-)-methyltransferase
MTLHKINLLNKSSTINLYNGYAVTLKADGVRYLLVVCKSNNEADNGKIYLINNIFNVIDTGYTDSYYNGTIIEGELINRNNISEFYCYDLLYSKGYDRRKNRLHNTDKTKKDNSDIKWSRLDHLDAFMRSGSRRLANGYNKDNSIEIKKKNYKFSTASDGSDIFEKTRELWETKDYVNFDVDGIIFTPINESYPYTSGTWSSLLKWKPHYYNTIDFLVKTIKYENRNDIKSPYTVLIKRPDGTFKEELRQFKTLKLYVGTRENVYDENTRRMKTIVKPVEFNPLKLEDEDQISQYNSCNILIDENEKMTFINDRNNKEEIIDDIIAEFRYDENADEGFKWIPLRIRDDKTAQYKEYNNVFGNMDTTANDIFRSYKYPVTEEMITTGKVDIDSSIDGVNNTLGYFAEFDSDTGDKIRLPYQNFHNHFIKTYLYMYVSPAVIEELDILKGKIFDYACGKGVDLNKIMRGRYSEVVGMDYDLNNIKFAIEYHKGLSVKFKPRAFYFRGDGSKLIFPNQACGFTDVDKISARKYIPMKYYFDVISVQFAMHYFFENEVMLRSFVQNLNDNLKIGGYYIGTCFDGKRIYDSLKGTKYINGKLYSGELFWKIEKKYTSRLGFDTERPIYGKEINVYVKSIGRTHPEYLVNFKFFTKLMEEYGFEMIFIKSFEELYDELMEKEGNNNFNLEKNKETAGKMSDDEKRFSFLNNAFCYKKISNSADSLLSKLIDKIDKEEKKKIDIKMDEKIKVIDYNTESLIENMEK